ncbi:hypothetical protein [Robiginitalea sp. IMCC43444]|uniref:hypothetical protein n=1 Tax=Robiginitalea sp. IMCC43444 TaxID=3459121 RepID=UPI00404228A2
MKPLMYVWLCLSLGMASAQQPTDPASGSNELSLNLLYSVLEIPEITYERILSDEMGIGFSLAIALDNEIEIQQGLAPFFRYYFGNNRADGFFVEANAAIYNYNDVLVFTPSGSSYDKKISFGLGFAAGVKLISVKGWMGKAYIGLGRRLDEGGDFLNWGYPRAGISFGKRF